MRNAVSPTLRIATGLLLAALLSVVGYQVLRRWNSHSPDAVLRRADEMSWLNNRIAAEPLYRQAELEFIHTHRLSKALYARVSQMPARSESSTTYPSQIAQLRHDLDLPEANEPEARLRILTILGMLEVNYDSGMARQTWADVEALAIRQRLGPLDEAINVATKTHGAAYPTIAITAKIEASAALETTKKR
jgi:hypothetical protein